MTEVMIKNAYTGPVKAVVLDWAGTAVDHGCMGPAAVFVDVFKSEDVDVTVAHARKFMGLAKKDHIRGMCGLPDVAAAWQDRYGRLPDESDVDLLYDKTAAMMVSAMARHADPIDGVLETVDTLRSMGIRIGSCTGYVREMMEVLVPAAREKGYHPDVIVCSSDVPGGRPYPWMCYENAIKLEICPMEAMVKIGDTVADVEEGVNAGMWTVGVTKTGNELGLSREAVASRDPETLQPALREIEGRFIDAGAHFCVERLSDILPVIETINQRLKAGERPPKG